MLKNILFFWLVVCCLGTSANAGNPTPVPSAGDGDILGILYLSDDAILSFDFWAQDAPDTFTLWVWLHAPELGLSCAEYQIEYPANVIPLNVISNPAIATETGSVTGPPGIHVCFSECQYGYVWMYQIVCEVTDFERSSIHPIPYEDNEVPEVADCGEPQEIGYAVPYSPFFINWTGGTNESSWGAIKQLYR